MPKRIVVSSDEDEPDDEPKAKRPRAAAVAHEAPRAAAVATEVPVTETEIVRAAAECRRAVIAEFPEYKPALRGVTLEVSARMQSAGAKTVFDAATLRPRCVRLSLPIFSVRSNLASLPDVVRHELAHAIAGREASHGPAWRCVCKKIGGTAALCHTLACGGEQPQRPQERARRPENKTRSSTDSWQRASESLISQIIRF